MAGHEERARLRERLLESEPCDVRAHATRPLLQPPEDLPQRSCERRILDHRSSDLDQPRVLTSDAMHHVGMHRQDAPVSHRAAERSAVMNLAGKRIDDRAGICVDYAAATVPALPSTVQQPERVRIVPVPIEPLPGR